MTAPAGGKPIYAPSTGGRPRRLDVECWQDECRRRRAGAFYCATHARRERRGTPMDAPIRRGAPLKYGATCAYPDCNAPAPRTKYCVSHGRRHRAGNLHKPVRRRQAGDGVAVCASWGCSKPRRAMTWCTACYARRGRGIARYGWRRWPTRWHAADPLLKPHPEARAPAPLLDGALAEVRGGGVVALTPNPLPAGEGSRPPLTRGAALSTLLGYLDD